jgi:DNA polymerase-3 subunit delta
MPPRRKPAAGSVSRREAPASRRRASGPLAPGEPLANFLRSSQAPPVFLLLGGDSYLRETARNQLIEFFVPEGVRDWAVRRLSAREAGPGEVIQHAESMPMLAPRQLILVKEIEAWQKSSVFESAEEGEGASRRSARADEADPAADLARYFENPATFTVLVFEAAELDQRTRLARLLNEQAQVITAVLAAGRDAEERRAAAIVASAAHAPELARQLGVSIEPPAAETLAEAVNGNLTQLRTELEKLAIYVGPGGTITEQNVEDLVASAREHSVWQFAGILAEGQRGRALDFLNGLLSAGEQPPAIVGVLAWLYRKLLEAQETPAAGGEEWQLSRELGMRPEMAALAARVARRIPRDTLRRSLAALYEADNRLKSGSADDRIILETLVTRLTTVRSGPAEGDARPIAVKGSNG